MPVLRGPHAPGILSAVGAPSDRRRSWRTELSVVCHLSRRTGKVIEARTLDIGPGGMRIHSDRPLAPDELLEFELPEHARVNGRARVLREQGYRIYALRFEKLGDEARSEISVLAGAATGPAPAR
ncbi:MAG TPA: PilZ domain-containing protein [Solirubrobacter sp.]|nr:PilZ domain-containing protein [Solirubrobacter sp.]